jgi:3-oxoacyl-[acyl-carrier-protein] synthase III
MSWTALIQGDIGANPEDPHAGAHGTFSFDVANGACGMLTALQIVDGFLRTHSVHRALVVASDADPGHGMSEHFPFSASGAALLCGWTDDNYGLSRVSWVNMGDVPADDETFSATVGFADRRNVLRFHQSAALDERFATAAAQATRACLDEHSLRLSEIDMIIAAPALPGYRTALSNLLGVPAEKICIAEDQRTHTAALAAAFSGQQLERLAGDTRVLFVAAGAGVVAGAALYRQPPRV